MDLSNVKQAGDDFSGVQPPMRRIPGVRVDLLRRAGLSDEARLVQDLVHATCRQERDPCEANQNAYAEAREAVIAALSATSRADAERWRQFRDGDCSVPAGPGYPAHDLVMARLNNATEDYVREGSGVSDYDAAMDGCRARAAANKEDL